MKKNSIKNNYYSTSDLALATTLSLWHPILEVDWSNSHKAHFIFKKTKQLESLVKDYYQNKIKISPQKYFSQLRIVKARLYAKG